MSNQKVCHIITSLNFGGIETIVRDFANTNPNDNIIVSLKESDTQFLKSLNHEIKHYIVKPGLKGYAELISIIKENSCSRIYSHVFSNIFFMTLLKILWNEKKIIQIIHNVYPLTRLSKTKNIIGYRLAYIFGIKIVCVSKAVSKYMETALFIKRTNVIYNGIQINDFPISCEKSNTITISHIGSFSEQKNYPLLISIFDSLSKKYSNVKLLLIGDGELKPSVYKDVENKNLLDKVRFTGLVLNISEELKESDIFLFPSLYEGFPKVIIETMAMGIVPVVSNYEAACEIIDHGTNGFIVKSGKIDEYLEYLSLLIEDSDKRKSLSKNARNKIMPEFTLDKMISAYDKL
jgi:glycosyltransferase involved in cell wall biosynthesis